MSIELIRNWLDDSSSVTSEEIDSAYGAMFEQMPSGPNFCLIACLSMMQDSDASNLVDSITDRVAKYEQEINW
jgi:hypothetical protein